MHQNIRDVSNEHRERDFRLISDQKYWTSKSRFERINIEKYNLHQIASRGYHSLWKLFVRQLEDIFALCELIRLLSCNR